MDETIRPRGSTPMGKARAARVPHIARRKVANGRMVAPPISSTRGVTEGICGIGLGSNDRQDQRSVAAARMTAACTMLPLIAAVPSESARVGYVIDGDTFRMASGERMRIAGIDAPVTGDDPKRFKERPGKLVKH